MRDNTISTKSISQNKPMPIEEPFTINEIIGQSPGWILRSGMTVLLIVVAIGIAMTFVIRYPDKIQALGVITTADPFKPIVTKSSGIVDTVFIKTNQLVLEETPILYIQNTANRNDVKHCIEQVKKLENKISIPITVEFHIPDRQRYDYNFIGLNTWNENFVLGPMQSAFASLDQQVKEFRYFLSRVDYALKLRAIDHEIEEIQFLNEVLEQEKELTEEEVLLSEKDVDRNHQLFDYGVISEREMERSQSGHIGIQKSYLLKGNNIAQNRIRIAALNQQKTDVHAAREEQIQLYQSRISEIILNFRNQFHQWYQQYYVNAPANGRIQLASNLVRGQTVTAGKSIGYVIPEFTNQNSEQQKSNLIYAKVFVSSVGIGKIKPGNRAIIRLEAYPYKEYGTIDSYVEEIYPIAEVLENGSRIYELHIPLDSLLMTDYGYPIHYTPEMPIQVAVIAKERSLFERIFDQFLNLLHHNLVKPNDISSTDLRLNKTLKLVYLSNLKSKIQVS